jgi:DNA-binding response OmpR family regulator
MATVLVIDDEPAIRRLCRAALEGAGHRVLEAAGGAQGLEAARRGRPDLVLLDLALPDLSGLEVCRRLGAARVLLLTGLAGPSEAALARRGGALGLISKPFSPAALLARVEGALSPSRRPQPA